MSTAVVCGIFGNDLSRCPLLLLLFTEISQELRAHLTGRILWSPTVISYARRLRVGPGNGSARPAGPSDWVSSLLDICYLGRQGCGADVLLREPHCVYKFGFVVVWEAEGTCAGTRLLDGHVRLDAGLGAGRGSGAGHAHPPPPVCSSLSSSSCSATAAKRIAIMEIAGEKDQTRSCSNCSRLWLWWACELHFVYDTSLVTARAGAGIFARHGEGGSIGRSGNV
jgi:hypothetical protein